MNPSVVPLNPYTKTIKTKHLSAAGSFPESIRTQEIAEEKTGCRGSSES